ncbi:hypothetical protein BOTBODRAFT_141596 [Botryobasidium botryosum FD-172 SS1]|uniref:No apical meristem-associated C-terminal domain-containing protein n=1 Tax=Botryobasidium botryosum (strain FD-172 SS1) TaxID=930990 RepID=A0A067NC71_BOTB1|nr:hypothetical protein BOTBODRAFT_141596 [Botryobasidium botryosum FD-172 SS1]
MTKPKTSTKAQAAAKTATKKTAAKPTAKSTKTKATKKQVARESDEVGEDEDEDGEDDDEDDEDEKGEGKGKLTIKWDANEFALTYQMINLIEDNPDLKRGLFPPVGANSSTNKGGGKAKVEHHLAVCDALFADHPEYKDVYAQATAPREKAKWANRVKNRFSPCDRMTKIVTKGVQQMGETGEGIRTEEEINMELGPNKLTNAWSAIKIASPWFFQLKDLMKDRPSHFPAGLGNSTTDIDMSVMQSQAGDEDGADGEHKGPNTNEGSAQNTQGDTNPAPAAAPAAPATPTSDIQALPAENVPANPAATSNANKRTADPTPDSQQKKKSKVAMDFAEVVKSEEKTRQMELDLAKANAELDAVKVKAKAEVKKAKIQAHLDRKRLRVELRMAKLQARMMAAPPNGPNAPNGFPPANFAQPFVPMPFNAPDGSGNQ